MKSQKSIKLFLSSKKISQKVLSLKSNDGDEFDDEYEADAEDDADDSDGRIQVDEEDEEYLNMLQLHSLHESILEQMIPLQMTVDNSSMQKNSERQQASQYPDNENNHSYHSENGGEEYGDDELNLYSSNNRKQNNTHGNDNKRPSVLIPQDSFSHFSNVLSKYYIKPN